MKSLIFLVSGNGGNLRFVHHAIKFLELGINISLIISDRECGAINFAKKEKIPFLKINYSKNNPEELDNLLRKTRPSIIVTNIHKILAPSTLSPAHRFINLHYSVLPAFKGLIGMQPVDEAEKIKCPFLGASTHSLIEEVDSGPIIQQGIFMVDWDRPKSEIYDTIFKIGNFILLNSILESKDLPSTDRLVLREQKILFSHHLKFNWKTLVKTNIWKIISDDTI